MRAHVGGRVRRVVELDLGELRDLGESRVGNRRGARLTVACKLHRAHDQRVRAPGGEADHERARVDPPEPAERLLGGARDDVDAQIEQHQEVSQIAREERHLVGARDEHLLGRDDRLDQRFDGAARNLPRGLLDVQVVGGQRGLELVLVEREQRG